MNRRVPNLARLLDYVWLAVLLFLIWEGLHYAGSRDVIASPAQTFAAILALVRSSQFFFHVSGTATAFAIGALVALSSGLVAGLALGLVQKAGDVVGPFLYSIYSIPKIILFPVVLLIFGVGISANVAFAALHGFFPIAIFAMNGVRHMPAGYLKTARVFRLSRLSTVLHVLIPAAMPEIVAGLRIGFSITLLSTLFGELLISARGLGHVLIRAMEDNDTKQILAVTVLIFAFAAVFNALFLMVERRVRRA